MPKISDTDALLIYERIKNGEKPFRVAKSMGVNSRRVSDITRRVTHKHLALEPLQTSSPSYTNKGKPLKERLENGSKLNEKTGCIEWQRKLHKDGYGMIASTGWRPNVDLTHRVAWRLAQGEIPKGMCVLHKCDNPKCCNVDHLFLGSHALNMHDMKVKLRATRGEKKKTAKLKESDVLEIVELLKLNFPLKDIASRYGVTASAIHNIREGETWWHISGIPHKPRLGSYLNPRFAEK